MNYATIYHGAPYGDDEHGHIAETFETTRLARRHLARRSNTTFAVEHRWAVVDGDTIVRELTPHELMLITDGDYAEVHGDKAP